MSLSVNLSLIPKKGIETQSVSTPVEVGQQATVVKADDVACDCLCTCEKKLQGPPNGIFWNQNPRTIATMHQNAAQRVSDARNEKVAEEIAKSLANDRGTQSFQASALEPYLQWSPAVGIPNQPGDQNG